MATENLSVLLHRLDSVERKGVRRLKVLAALSLVAIFCLAYLVYSAVDVQVKLSKAPRVIVSTAALALFGVALFIFAVRTLRAHIGAKRAALEVEQRLGHLESAVSTSVEFGTNAERTERLSSPAVVEKLVEDTQERTKGLEFARAVSWRRPLLVGALTVAVIALCAAYFVTMPRLAKLTFLRFVAPWANLPAPTLTWCDVEPGSREVRRLETVEVTGQMSGRLPRSAEITFAVVPEDAGPATELQWRTEKMLKTDAETFTFSFPRMLDSVRYVVTAGDFASESYLLTVYEVPKITQLKMLLNYPEYTGMKPKAAEDAVGPVTALRGTEVRITGIVNKTIGNAAVQFDAETEPKVPAAEIKGNQFTVVFSVGEHSKYRLLVTDLQRRTNDDSAFYTIKCVDDNAPDIKIAKPAKNLTMIKTAEVPLEIQTSDDYGLSEVGVAYKIKEDEWKRLPLADVKAGAKEAKPSSTLFLEDMALADTDVVTYYAYARDNDTVSGPKESASDLFFVEIEPFGQQYKLMDEAGAKMPPGMEDQQKVVLKLEDIIKKQKEVITKTFRVDKEFTLKKKFTEEQVTQVKDLGSQENELRKRTDDLSKNLQEQLMAAGLAEDLDRVENLDRAGVRMGLASLTLDGLDTATALPYENDALYHLYRAKRDILNLIAKHQGNKELAKQLRQALDMAAKNQQQDEQQERQEKMKELQKKDEDLAQMQEEQKGLNKQLHEQAAQQAQAQSQSGKEQPSQQQQQQREDMAKKEERLAQKAQETANELRQMDFNNPNQSYQAAKDTAKAAGEMQEAQKAMQDQKMADARDHGVKAEKELARARKQVQRALERSVTDQLRDAANQARELAENQRQIGKETEQLAMAPQGDQRQPQPGQEKQAQQGQPQPGQEKQAQQGQPQPGQEKQAQQGQPQAQPQQGEKADVAEKDAEAQKRADTAAQKAAPQVDPEKKRQEIAERQAELRKDADRLGETLADLTPRVKQVDPEIGAGVEKEADKLQAAQPQKPMERAENALQKKNLAAARSEQRNAQRPLDEAAKNLRDLAEQFTMDDAARIAKAIEKARELAEKQDTLNKRVEQTARAQQKPDREEAENKQADAQAQAQQQQGGQPQQQQPPQGQQQGRQPQQADAQAQAQANQQADAQAQAQANQQANAQQAGSGQQGQPQERKSSESRPAQDEQKTAQKPETREPEAAAELAQKQNELRQGTDALSKQVERLKSLEKSNLDQQIKESLAKASGHMTHSEMNIRENNPQASAAHGQEASTELKQSMKAMRRALTESLNERLAEAVQQAQKTAQAQKSAKETLDKAAKDKERAEPIAPDKQDRAAREQTDAQDNLNQLQRDLQALARQSRSAGEQPLAESVDKAQKEMDEAKTPQRMAQAQKDIKERNWPSARQNQQSAAASTSAAHERLKDLYQDQTALPMQKMKNAVESAKQLAENVKDMEKKVEKLEADKGKPGQPAKGQEPQKVAQEQQDLQKKSESLADRLKRLDPNAQDLKQNAEELTTQMKQATQRLAKGQTKDVMPGLNKASKALQSISDGLIQRINRLADKEKRRDPEEEKAPAEYRKLVEQYTRALSED